MSPDELLKKLPFDAPVALLSSKDEAIKYFAVRDLKKEGVYPVDFVWQLPGPQNILKKQMSDGFWKYHGIERPVYPPYHYALMETLKSFYTLVITRIISNSDNQANSKVKINL